MPVEQGGQGAKFRSLSISMGMGSNPTSDIFFQDLQQYILFPLFYYVVYPTSLNEAHWDKITI